MNDPIDIKQRYLNKIHNDLLILMDEVDRICKDHNLRYYLMGGSCLGAIRHKGFIPWDDDLDIAMPRKDFNKLVALASKDKNGFSMLSDHLYLRWISSEKFYNQDFAKICRKGTVFKENNGKAAQNAGIFIDVFPLDACGPYSRAIERRSTLYNFLHGCLFLKGAEKSQMDWKFRHWFRNSIVLMFSNKTIYKIMLWIINLHKTKSEFNAFFSSPYPIKRQVFPKDWHGEGKRALFEGRFYICPDEPEKLMRIVFGDNYMELPPLEKRKTHYPIRVVFIDGEEMLFEKPKKKIQYKDILG